MYATYARRSRCRRATSPATSRGRGPAGRDARGGAGVTTEGREEKQQREGRGGEGRNGTHGVADDRYVGPDRGGPTRAGPGQAGPGRAGPIWAPRAGQRGPRRRNAQYSPFDHTDGQHTHPTPLK